LMIYNEYITKIFFFHSFTDPRVKDWFLMSSPVPGICIIAGYLYFVLRLGPKFMENRKPFQIDNIIKIYNFIQVVLCGWLFAEVSSSVIH
jgi:elongation of very long chain fatty acids protein 7